MVYLVISPKYVHNLGGTRNHRLTSSNFDNLHYQPHPPIKINDWLEISTSLFHAHATIKKKRAIHFVMNYKILKYLMLPLKHMTLPIVAHIQNVESFELSFSLKHGNTEMSSKKDTRRDSMVEVTIFCPSHHFSIGQSMGASLCLLDSNLQYADSYHLVLNKMLSPIRY